MSIEKLAARSLPLGMPSARKLNAHELSVLLLVLLEEAPTHGSALIERIEHLSQGFYRPSPGSLYPALSRLLDQGLIKRFKRGRLKVYQLTNEGHTYCLAHCDDADSILARLQRAGRKLAAMRSAYELNMPDEDISTLAQAMLEARMDLKAALHESLALPPEKQRLIIAALHTTSATIRALDVSVPSDDENEQDAQ